MTRRRYVRPKRMHLALLSLPFVIIGTACSSSGSGNGSTAPIKSPSTPARVTTPVTDAPTTAGGPNPNATETPPPGDIPDNQVFVPYTPVSRTFTLRVPEGWAMTQTGSMTVFTDKYNSASVQSLAVPAAPTVASSTAIEVPAIRAAAHGFVAGTVTTANRTAGTAIQITYRADSAPNPVTGNVAVEAVERYEFWRNGTEVVITLSAPVGSDNVDPWRTITDSFRWM